MHTTTPPPLFESATGFHRPIFYQRGLGHTHWGLWYNRQGSCIYCPIHFKALPSRIPEPWINYLSMSYRKTANNDKM